MATAPPVSKVNKDHNAESLVVYQAENVYRKVTGRGKHDAEEQVYGSFALLQKVDGYRIEWNPSHTHIMKLDSYEGGEDWGVVNGVGYRNSGNDETIDEEPGAGQLYTKSPSAPAVTFNISNLAFIKLLSKVFRNHSGMEFSLTDGTKYGPLYFQDGGTRDFVGVLEKVVFVKSRGGHTYYIDHHAPNALNQSLKELKIYNNTQQAVSRFLRNPVQATFTGFAKIHKVLTEALVTPPADELEVDPMLSAEIMRMSLQENEDAVISEAPSEAPSSVPIDTCREEEPGYAFVDESLNLSKRIDMPRGPKLTKEIWKAYQDQNGRCTNPDAIKHIIFRGGIATDIRPEMWRFLLGMYPWTSTAVERDEIRNDRVKRYFSIKLQWKSIDSDQESRWSTYSCHKQLVEKDVNRTDRTSLFYRGEGNQNLVHLHDILMTYVFYNFNLAYVQGMSDLLSPLLIILDNEVDAFWCFTGFMDMVGSNFAEDQSGMKLQLAQLNLLVQILDKDLFNFLESKDSGNMYFAFRWLLILFKREFTMDDIFRLWEVFWTRLPCVNYQLILALDMLLRQKKTIIGENMDFTDILKHINELSTRMNAEEILMSSESLSNQLIRCKNLPDDISRIFGLPCAAERKEKEQNANYIV